MSSTPDDKPQRATAAQLASRRIKEVRRRRPGTAAPGTTTTSFGGPFSSLDPNTVSSTPAASQPMTNGFTFGQSQSFPGAGSTPKPPTENGGTPFAFGGGGGGATGGSSSFNFSASFGGSGTSSNPFATMNTAGASQQPDAGSFSGFKGNLFNVPPAASQSPAQQPLPSGGLFGTGSQQNSTTGGLFGTSATTGASTQPSTTIPTTGGFFGQSSTNAPSINVFGQSTPEKPTAFGQSTAFSDDSMQTSPDAKATASKPSIFGTGTSSQPSFGGTNLFGGSTSTASEKIPSKPLFGAQSSESSAPASTSLFGGPIQPSSSISTTSSSAPAPVNTLMTSAAPSSPFPPSTTKPATPLQNPFQAANLFSGVPTPAATQKPADEKKEEPKANGPSQAQSGIMFPAATSDGSLFSKSTTAPSQSNTLFQPPSTGSLFTPKAPASTEQEKPKPSETPQANPFSSLFTPKPAAQDTPKTEQKSLPSSPSLNNLFAPKPSTAGDGSKTNDAPKPASPTPTLFSSSPVKPAVTTGSQAPAFSISATPQSAQKSPFAFGTPSQSPAKANGETSTPSAVSKPSTPGASAQSFEKLQPAKMPSNLDKNTNDEVEMLYRVRLLNECFRREVSQLDPATGSFDALVQFYMRVRETIGAPLEIGTGKRKTSDDEDSIVNTQPAKKAKPFGTGEGVAPLSSSSLNAGSPFKLSGDSQAPPTNKRKSAEDSEGDARTSQPQKRVNGDSTTANIFANSFSRSKTSDSENELSHTQSPQKANASSFKPSIPAPNTPTSFSTTPTSSPSKPLFTLSASTKESSTSTLFAQPLSATKPTFTAPTDSTTPKNPFVLKPQSDGASTAPPALNIPKFGAAATGGTNFFAQFKAQSDKEAEKEKAKRKAEDFDSDEDDEAEWERQDAENQRKKKEELEAQKSRRAKFIPGQGFSFEEDDDAADGTKTDEAATSSLGSSVFDAKNKSSTKPNNIFGHLSATPSETEEIDHEDDAEDTEEASADGDEISRDPSFVPTSEDDDSQATGAESAKFSSSFADSPGRESSDDGDLTKALKKSKQASISEQATTEEPSSQSGAGSRSLFDRVQYDDEGKPKRQGEPKKDNTLSTFFNSSKFASSFNSPAAIPNPFAPATLPQSDKADDSSTSNPAPTNIFGASTTTGSVFGSPAPTPSGANTPSLFGGSSTPKAAGDNTWKINTPIKFAPDSATTSQPKPDSGVAAAPAADSSKPFSALFGAPTSGSKSASGGAAPTLGFSFGAPSQQNPSFLTPSVLNSATPSRASTPGVTSDTGAEESGDGDAAESLPQVNLARSGAGEENEDVVVEARARAMKIVPGAGWESQGVGYVRVLKDQTTSKGRALLRADPSGKVILNTSLNKAINYTASGSNVQFLVPKADGPPEQWALRLKGGEEAGKVATAMEETKS